MKRTDDQLPPALRALRTRFQEAPAPDGYFEELEERMLARVATPAPRRIRPRRTLAWLSAAAAVLLLAVIGWGQLSDSPDTSTDDLLAAELLLPTQEYVIDDELLFYVTLLEAEDLILEEEVLVEEMEYAYLLEE